MNMLFKFKDGSTVALDLKEYEKKANANIVEYLLKAKQKNEPITFKVGDQDITRKFDDLYSVEFLF